MLKSVNFNLLANTHSGSDPDETPHDDRGHYPALTDEVGRKYIDV